MWITVRLVGLRLDSVFILLIILAASRRGHCESGPPSGFVVSVGHKVLLPCSTNLSRPASWSFLPVERTVPDTVFVNGRLVSKATDHYQMDISVSATGGRQYNLVVRSVESTDAGEYVCRENNGRAGERFWETELVVLTESYMNCWENYTEFSGVYHVHRDIVVSECSFNFIGNLVPTVSWTDSTGREVLVQTSVRPSRKDVDGTVYQYVETSAVVTSESENTGPFACSVGFTTQQDNSKLANVEKTETGNTKTTTPVYTWTSKGSVKFVGGSRRNLIHYEIIINCLLAITTVFVLVFLLVSMCLRKHGICGVSYSKSKEDLIVDEHEIDKDDFVIVVPDKKPLMS